MNISGRAKLAGVIGWPVAHSLSPALHGYWINTHSLDAAYVPLAIRPEDFRTAVKALSRSGFAGFNVTLPHKVVALDLCDEVDEAARKIGAVNTLVFSDDKIHGRNTDGEGFSRALAEGGIISLQGQTAGVLGAGGAAAAVVWSLVQLGAEKIFVFNRTEARSHEFVKRFGDCVVAKRWEETVGFAGQLDVLVNTTSLGMTGQEALVFDVSKLAKQCVVVDIVYRPLVTELLRDAQRAGHRTIDGLGMLLHQAAPGFHAWFGVQPQVDAGLRSHLMRILGERV